MKPTESEEWWKVNLLTAALALALGGTGWLILEDVQGPANSVASMNLPDRPAPPRWTITTTRAS